MICAHQALTDFGVAGSTFNVEIISGDHKNDPKLGTDIARRWIEQDGVDVIVDVPNSDVALAVSGLCREKDKISLDASATAVTLTGEHIAALTRSSGASIRTWLLDPPEVLSSKQAARPVIFSWS